MSGYVEFRMWSPALGCDAVRLSMANDRGDEYYMVVPYEHGKVWRERKHRLLDLIDSAIEQGLEPGEVFEQE